MAIDITVTIRMTFTFNRNSYYDNNTVIIMQK